MADPQIPTHPASAPDAPSIERRRAILRRLGQGSVVAAAAAVPVAASAGMLSRWNLDPAKRAGSSGMPKLGASA